MQNTTLRLLEGLNLVGDRFHNLQRSQNATLVLQKKCKHWVELKCVAERRSSSRRRSLYSEAINSIQNSRLIIIKSTWEAPYLVRLFVVVYDADDPPRHLSHAKHWHRRERGQPQNGGHCVRVLGPDGPLLNKQFDTNNSISLVQIVQNYKLHNVSNKTNWVQILYRLMSGHLTCFLSSL